MKYFILQSTFILVVTFSNAQSKLNDTLIKQLDIISTDDQTGRVQLESTQYKYANDTFELKIHLNALWKVIRNKDSINQIKVIAILDKYGWLGPEIIGDDGNTTLFMVIQHADQVIQEKYLPMMRGAVKNGKAKARSLALLEDRVALEQGNKQIYGSQVAWNMLKNEYTVLPLYDPDNVDKRRAEVGLQPLAIYLSNWQLKWDIQQYKKDLPSIEAWVKSWRK